MFELSLLVAAADGTVRLWSLLFGIGSFIGGIMLIQSHRKALERATEEAETARNERFELRKYRRRSLVGSLIASMGVMLAGLYWVTDLRAYSAFLLMILGLLAWITAIAIIDMFSVSLHTLTDTRSDDHESLINEYQRRKKEHDARPLGPGEESR